MALIDHVNSLNQRILQGDILGAFESYYADNVEMAEIGQEPRVGKEANRAYEEQFVNSLTAFHGAEVKNVAVNETGLDSGVAFCEWFMHFDHSEWGADTRLEQVSVQEWEKGQIVRETFYHA